MGTAPFSFLYAGSCRSPKIKGCGDENKTDQRFKNWLRDKREHIILWLPMWTPGTKRVYISMAILLVYMLVLSTLGFIIPSVIMLFAFSPMVLFYMIAGVAAGICIGALPGLTATMGVALLLPLTFGMDATAGILMLLGISQRYLAFRRRSSHRSSLSSAS